MSDKHERTTAAFISRANRLSAFCWHGAGCSQPSNGTSGTLESVGVSTGACEFTSLCHSSHIASIARDGNTIEVIIAKWMLDVDLVHCGAQHIM